MCVIRFRSGRSGTVSRERDAFQQAGSGVEGKDPQSGKCY